LKLVNISLDRNKGPGWVNVEFSGLENFEKQLYLVIERKGHAEQYLSETGWRVAEIKFHVECIRLENGNSILMLRPHIVQYLGTGNNYQFSLFDQSFNLLGLFVANWKGVPSFTPRRDKDPILQLSSLPDDIKLVDNYVTIDTAAVENAPHNATDTDLIAMPSGEDNVAPNITSEKSPFDQFNIFNTISFESKKVTPELEIINTETPQKLINRFKIKCSNRNCNLDIYNTMNKCPYCGQTQGY